MQSPFHGFCSGRIFFAADDQLPVRTRILYLLLDFFSSGFFWQIKNEETLFEKLHLFVSILKQVSPGFSYAFGIIHFAGSDHELFDPSNIWSVREGAAVEKRFQFGHILFCQSNQLIVAEIPGFDFQ